jgi:16S rRNA (cytosine967-C5)-methyltransferase
LSPSSNEDRVAPARRAAYEVLRRVFEHGAWADRALPAALRRQAVPERQRGLAQRLAYGAVQRRGTSDALIENLSGRPVDELDSPLLAALRLGLFELLFSASPPDYAAVDQAVELAKRSAGGRGGAGLVNAVLRRAARERQAALAALAGEGPDAAALVHSHPAWIARKWWLELGAERAESLMAAGNEATETGLRANLLRIEPPKLIALLAGGGATVEPAGGPPPLDVPELVVVRGELGSSAPGAIERGEALPQSRGSAAVVAVLDPRPGERVLDLCAGPGIKTTQIAARMEGRGEVISVEADPGRARLVHELARRTGAGNVRVLVADAAGDDAGGGYDRVLVDAPCSDLGTLASRPDARWRKGPELVERLAVLQRRILERATAALRPGGTLVYSTCTISRTENEDQIITLLEAGSRELHVDDLGGEFPELASAHDSRFLQTLPDRDRTDGFFIARLREGS